MLVYKYNEITKEFIEEYECQKDPLESLRQNKDIYLIPNNCTNIKSLEKKDDFAIIFNKNNNCWEYIPDYRNKKVFTGTKVILWQQIGELPEGNRLITQKEDEGLNNGTMVIKNGKIVKYTKPKKQIIQEYEQQIEELNNKIIRDIIILQDPNSSSLSKIEAQTYFNNKAKQKQEIIEKINKLK